jgi:nucleotide-binding universal stress UspA family protein
MKNKFSRALVALDLSSMDRELIRYFAEIYGRLDIKRVYFVHIMPDFTAPGKEDPRFQKLFNPEEPLDEKIRQRIQEQVDEVLGQPEGLEINVNVIEGKPYQKLMHWLEVKEAHLLILGKKPDSEGSGITAKRVARHASCHVLLVAPRARGQWRTLLAPIDFSNHSAQALQFAFEAREKDPELLVQGLYIVEMPLEDYYYAKSNYPGYRSVLLESARDAFQHFLESNQLKPQNMEMEFVENDYGNVSTHIAEYAKAEQPDLLVVGAQGHSAMDRFLFGSVTEKLLEKVKGLTVMLIR